MKRVCKTGMCVCVCVRAHTCSPQKPPRVPACCYNRCVCVWVWVCGCGCGCVHTCSPQKPPRVPVCCYRCVCVCVCVCLCVCMCVSLLIQLHDLVVGWCCVMTCALSLSLAFPSTVLYTGPYLTCTNAHQWCKCEPSYPSAFHRHMLQ